MTDAQPDETVTDDTLDPDAPAIGVIDDDLEDAPEPSEPA